MIATNASGSHGLRYGATKNYVLSLRAVLSNGEILEIDHGSNGELASSFSPSPSIGRSIIDPLKRLLLSHKDAIFSRYPDVKKNSSGYNLLDSVKTDRLDLTKILTGSEGTLAVIVGAKLRIVDIPRARSAGLVSFQNYDSMTETVLAALPLSPAAIELVDKTLLDLAREQSTVVEGFAPDDTQALVLFEFEGETAEEAETKLNDLWNSLPRNLRLASASRAKPEHLESFWTVRKEATRILETVQSPTKKASFIEDVTVPVSLLQDYLKGLTSILRSHEVSFSIYGHAGVGNVHCEPLLDLRRSDHRVLLDVLGNEVFDLALLLGGTLSGEHGDGFVRTPYLERLYGRELYELFRSVKKIFDPQEILNPGKIVGPQGASIAHDLKI